MPDPGFEQYSGADPFGGFDLDEDDPMDADAPADWRIDDGSDHLGADNSFSDEIQLSSENDWDVDADAIWGDPAAGIEHHLDADPPPL